MIDLPAFPPRLVFNNEEDLEVRRHKLQEYLQDIVSKPFIFNTWELQFFLEIKIHLGTHSLKKVLVPLPDAEFDPTEVAVPWRILRLEGHEVVFATEAGKVPKADEMLTRPEGVIFGQLGAETEAVEFYKLMEQDANFCHPITWASITPEDYDAMLLGGGHAPGMKQYLESEVLQQKVAQFFKLNRPVASICHGALLLARSKDPDTGKSVLAKRKTTTLPKYMETLGFYCTRLKYGNLFRTYEMHCEDEVRSLLEDPETQFQVGPTTIGAKGNAFDDDDAFVCADGNYLSARWPGDAYLLGRKLANKLSPIDEDEEKELEKDAAVFERSRKEESTTETSVNSEVDISDS
jgi:putative intracellular protease/amidase